MNPNLKTERLLLKPVSENDIENVFKLQSLEETARFNTSGIPINIDETRKIVENWIIENNKENTQKFTFIIELTETQEFIGLIGINLGKPHYKNAEICIQFDYRFWNKGFAT